MSSAVPPLSSDDFPAGQTSDMREVLPAPPTKAKPATTGRWVPPSAQELAAMLPQYEIESMLGRGGMGAVYKGTQIALDRPVAIKILSNQLEEADASFAERFKNEAKAMAKLSHPGIVGVYDFGETAGGLLYIVMEFIEGTDVAKMLTQQKRLHTEHAMAITAHVCDALAYAHERGIIHRDIKPANIMVGYDGVVKVADFGLAKMSSTNAQSGLTQSGMAVGTLHYMAPEAIMLGSALDHRSDVYAVGVMLYQMLTGKLPQGLFEMPSLQVPGLDPRYDGIIGKALREDRELRYPRVLDMRHDLDAILTQPVAKVEAAAAKAPAALQTQARPQRPGGQPYRPPQPEVIVRTEKKGVPLHWTAIVALAALAVWLYVKKSAPEGAPAASVPVVGSPPVTDTSPAQAVNASSSAINTNPAQATNDRPFVNSLGMKFVPVPGTKVLFCIHETRYRDFAAYAENDNSLAAYWKQQSHDDLKVGDNGKDHPVVNVSKKETQGFCQWLSQKESHTYRLPKDAEWSAAAGVAEAEQRSEGMLPSTVAIKQLGFPWGNTWPPPSGSGNYSDESRRRTGRGQFHIAAYDDGYPTTSPVMRFPPNHLGIYDMGGNVWEWCEDKFHSTGEEIGLRGGSWHDGQEGAIRLSRRTLYLPDQRNAGNGFRCVVEIENAGVTVTKANSLTLSASSSQAKPPTQNSQNASGEITMTKEQDSRQASLASPTTWTDTKGRSLTATFKAIASSNVLLDIAGKVTHVPLNTLSAESQKLARDYQQALEAGAAKSTVQPSEVPADAFAYGTSRYAYFAEAMNWQEARSRAESLGGHLVTLNTQAEEASVAAQVRARHGTGITNFWIGGILDAPLGSWRWITGEGFTYTHWDIKEPKNAYATDQRSAPPFVVACHLNRESHIGWRDYSVSHPYWQSTITGYLVEWDHVPATTQPASAAPSSLVSPASATKKKPFVNSLGMKFVPMPITGGPTNNQNVLFSLWETRVQDYAVFAAETNQKVHTPEFKQAPTHPVVMVSWDDAHAFCEWMTDHDHKAGLLGTGQRYRLPSDHEWSCAVGLGRRENAAQMPVEKSGQLGLSFPWGQEWPPQSALGNFAGEELRKDFEAGKYGGYLRGILQGVNDGHVETAPVGSFPPHSSGLHDLSGNVWEWCEDWYDSLKKDRVLRGGGWDTYSSGGLSSASRNRRPPPNHLLNCGFRIVLELQGDSSASSLPAPPTTTAPQTSATTWKTAARW